MNSFNLLLLIISFLTLTIILSRSNSALADFAPLYSLLGKSSPGLSSSNPQTSDTSRISRTPSPSLSEILLTPSPTSGPVPTFNADSPVAEFLYPQATQVSTDSNSLVLQTSDSSQTVTDWYKQKIKDEGFTTTSFVQTNTNGDVLNRLVGSGNGTKIAVEISQNSEDSVATIRVTINESA